MAVLAARDKVKRNRASFDTDRHLEHSTPIFGLPVLLFLIKFGEILCMVHRRTWPKTSIHSLSRSFKNLSFFAFKTCCEILLCKSIAIIH